jgi:hypothetical protein
LILLTKSASLKLIVSNDIFLEWRCHPQNIIWTEAKLRSIYYFVGDRPVHKLSFGQKCHELFVILCATDQSYSNQNTIGCIIWTLLIHILMNSQTSCHVYIMHCIETVFVLSISELWFQFHYLLKWHFFGLINLMNNQL